MPTTQEQRAEISRQNSKKSTGPKTEEGKAASRCNALKHGLAATTVAPVDAPGEPTGAYQARLDAWVEDLKPANVLELTMVQRACRASWKLDRVARYEDAAAAFRMTHETSTDTPGAAELRKTAARIGNQLMSAVSEVAFDRGRDPNARPEHNNADDAPRDADALGRFKEGVAWLLHTWATILPHLAEGAEGADVFLARNRARALRLLGIPTGAPEPAQPLLEAGEAEVRRLKIHLVELSDKLADRIDADLALFTDSPEAQLFARYEANAERELHRAVNTFMKLRKNPELVAPAADPDPDPSPEPDPAPESREAPAQNEASPPARPTTPNRPQAPQKAPAPPAPAPG